MKNILLLLLLSAGCSVARYYHAAEVTTELKKNSTQLDTLVARVEEDFSQKESFFKQFTEQAQDKKSFLMQELAWRLMDMKNKRDSIVAKSAYIKTLNESLLSEISKKKEVKEKDPAFKKIENFSQTTAPDAKILFNEYAGYRSASEEFVRFALFSRNMLNKSASIKR